MSENVINLPSSIPPLRDLRQRPLQDLRISVMDRCNFRCPYCMPEDKYHEHFKFLDSTERLSFDEILRVTRLFAGLGVSKIRITGGEPLLRPGLTDLIGDLSRIEGIEDIALTTNGILLGQHAAALRAAGLNRVTVSLDSLNDEVFSLMSGGRGSKDRVLAGISEAAQAGLMPIKINAVIKRGINNQGALDLVEHFRGSGVIVRFIEYMDVGTINHWQETDTVPSAELVQHISQRWPMTPVERNYHGEVASRYRFMDGQGEVGFISSVSDPFCGSCTRIRLSSDGQLFTCLFAAAGTDLKGLLRVGTDDDELLKVIGRVWGAREDRYSEVRAEQGGSDKKVEMYYIGG
ncbi:MAG: GTP 3',8-cyclase MoaA [Gammaproteobacteria bacterium]|jgi:cyclic pyranopterin phosphate synthase|nr:GTP 3',8-cyclase MoaA [Gammaproteobacteria bacterium]MDP7153114.1 GTP 3',8-cyclase MoaA [Gammaproteobacteria bacterium]MDP7296323.1 GTP 3',8-cyclase MoaA [Gammaproteobacteria bacterium]MDP7419576.1 GTP 3',8-cyclase MoaA [Gammaproteobacteria bacterium]MDP7661284.1 GTP 3',8-cyclase MoaA [Gammaproteobacteria bacterium]